jgi:hypothetical protein
VRQRLVRVIVGLATLALGIDARAVHATAQASGLKIVVLEGEDAINVIQQKTAVATLVEVRDQNDLPVGGATVTFSVNGGKAVFAGGTQQITVTTNAAGRAAASALNPLQSGAIRIQVEASFQGQTASASIAQTNVATAADAAAQTAERAQLGRGSSSSGGSGTASGTAAGAGAGGGLSGAAVAGIVGGVAAGAGLGIKAASSGGDDSGGGGGGNSGGGGGGGGGATTPCRLTLSQTSVSTNSLPSSTTIQVTAEPANCTNGAWTATASSASSFFLLSNNSAVQTGNGNGSFTVNIPENRTGASRSGSVSFTPAGQTVSVSQGANCVFNVMPTSFGNISGLATGDVVAVILTNSPCEPQTWTAFSNQPQYVSVSPTSGSGSGVVNVSFTQHLPPAGGPRPIGVTVAGIAVSGNQLVAGTTLSACQARSLRGGDVGETQTLDLGRTSGPFLLKYDTGDRSDDRVVVSYEGRMLFDSGCVSTGGPQMRSLSYSGNSSLITVQVTPNCHGGWGSAWSVELACSPQ